MRMPWSGVPLYLNILNVSKEKEHCHSDSEEDASLNESSDASDDDE